MIGILKEIFIFLAYLIGILTAVFFTMFLAIVIIKTIRGWRDD